jgi:hypothetical protein
MNSFSQGSPSHSETTEIYTNAVKVPNKLQNVQPISVPNLPQLETTFSALPNNVGPSDLDGEDTEDDDMEWEEIDIMQNAAPGLLQTQNVEIVLERAQETIKLVNLSDHLVFLTLATENVVTLLISWSVNCVWNRTKCIQ